MPGGGRLSGGLIWLRLTAGRQKGNCEHQQGGPHLASLGVATAQRQSIVSDACLSCTLPPIGDNRVSFADTLRGHRSIPSTCAAAVELGNGSDR